MNTDIDQRVVEFLGYLLKQKVAALVLYGFSGPAGPVLRMKSNQPEGVSLGVLKLIEGTDERAVDTGARALATAAGITWADLSAEDQDKHRVLAHAVLEAARGNIAKNVTIHAPEAQPVIETRGS